MDIAVKLAPVLIAQATKYMNEKKTSPNHELAVAAAAGDLDALDDILGKQPMIDRAEALVAAASRGRLGALEILAEPPPDKHADKPSNRRYRHEPPKTDLNCWFENKTPLIAAAHTGHKKAAALLLDEGADTELAQRNTGMTALHHAAKDGDWPMAKVLVDHGARVDSRDKEGNTPLLLAARYNHANTLDYLLEAHADIEARDKKGSTALLLACRHDSVRGVELLLKEGANPKVKDKKGRNALHRAVAGLDLVEGVASKKKEIMVKKLLYAGISPTDTDKEGKTPGDRCSRLRGGGRVKRLLIPEKS